MNDYWHIPRASLASASSSNVSSAASSASSTQHSKPGLQHTMVAVGVGQNNKIETSAAATAAAAAAVLAAAANKRGSRSSQGSSDSNNSTRSAASGSLLLTAANLERFAEIHKKQERQNKLLIHELPNIHANAPATTQYSTNLVHALAPCYTNGQPNDTVIPMDPNLQYIKTKDLDTVSIASSMHFTMVNGEAGTTKKPKRGLCDRGRQVTVLIVVMSTIFMLLIMGMVYALEMRARVMPKS